MSLPAVQTAKVILSGLQKLGEEEACTERLCLPEDKKVISYVYTDTHTHTHIHIYIYIYIYIHIKISSFCLAGRTASYWG